MIYKNISATECKVLVKKTLGPLLLFSGPIWFYLLSTSTSQGSEVYKRDLFSKIFLLGLSTAIIGFGIHSFYVEFDGFKKR